MLYPHHLASLEKRAITPAYAEYAGLESNTAASAAADVFGSGSDNSLPGDTVRIPYYNLDGSEMLGEDGVPYARHRVFPTEAPSADKKEMRYIARPSSGVRPYLPLGIQEVIDRANLGFLVITEGEFKAISACEHRIPCVGISGVTMWCRSSGGAPVTEDSPVHPEIIELVKQAGGAVVLADSDAVKNRQVKKQMSTLARAIYKQTGLPAAYTHVPQEEVGGKALKLGLDDYIARHEGSINTFVDLLTWHFKKEQHRVEILSSGGYVPLGFVGDKNAVWSVERGCLFMLSNGNITQSGTLMNLAGGLSWCEAAFGKPKGDEGIAVDWTAMGGDIIERCLEAGPFELGSIRGAGVWQEGEDLVINDGDGLWTSSGRQRERHGRDYVYPMGKRMGIRPEVQAAGEKHGRHVLAAMKTWHWTRPNSDPILLLGWLCLGYLAGALPWRPHISLTGPAGTGKSALQKMVGNLLGNAGLVIEGNSSEPGIRQHVRQDARAVILDEAEADGTKIGSLLTMLRSASDDKVRLMGTQDQSGVSYTLRIIGMVSGIVPPAMNAADTTRFVRIELDKVNAEAARAPHPLVSDEELAKKVGLSLWRRTINQWPRIKAYQVVFRDLLDGSTRYRDSLAPILAAAYCATFDEDLTAERAQRMIQDMDLADLSERMSEARDEADAQNHLLGTSLDLQIGSGRRQMTVAELCACAFEEVLEDPRGGEHQRALGRHGMRIAPNPDNHELAVLMVNPKAPGFVKIYQGTKWERGDIGALLRRSPGAERKVSQHNVSIGGSSVRPSIINLPKLERPIHADTHLPRDPLAEISA